MLQRRRAIENPYVARQMRQFFDDLPAQMRKDPEEVALAYARYLWKPGRSIKGERRIKHSRFSMGLTSRDEDFRYLAKRGTLVSDTLLLSHLGQGEFHGFLHGAALRNAMELADTYGHLVDGRGIFCPNLKDLGTLLLDAEPLLQGGILYYLPVYNSGSAEGYLRRSHFGIPAMQPSAHKNLIDFLIQRREVIDLADAAPTLTGKLARPVFRIELPFIDGVSLREFSKITIGEFGSYESFKDFLRGQFLSIDDALDSVESQRALTKIELEIRQGVRSIEADIRRTRSRRAVASTGAFVGTVGAVVVAVCGPAFADAVSVVGAGGSLWTFINAIADNKQELMLQQGQPWRYVWLLERRTSSP